MEEIAATPELDPMFHCMVSPGLAVVVPLSDNCSVPSLFMLSMVIGRTAINLNFRWLRNILYGGAGNINEYVVLVGLFFFN